MVQFVRCISYIFALLSLAPCSPGQGHPVHKHVRSAIRMSSMELPDENDYSSASTSPCPSPHTNNQNHRINLYVVLYNFNARHRDELDLKWVTFRRNFFVSRNFCVAIFFCLMIFFAPRAGYKITVMDKSEKDWWKGKCLGGRAGYFPSAYVMRVESGQKTLQVTRNLQLADQTTLLRDQVCAFFLKFNYSIRLLLGRDSNVRALHYCNKLHEIDVLRDSHRISNWLRYHTTHQSVQNTINILSTTIYNEYYSIFNNNRRPAIIPNNCFSFQKFLEILKNSKLSKISKIPKNAIIL